MKRETINSFLLTTIIAAMLITACGGSKKSTENADGEGAGLSNSVMEKANAYMSQAALSLSEEDYQGAMGNYLAAAEIYDKDGAITVERAEAHFLAAALAYQIGEKQLAIDEYDESVKIYLRFKGNNKMKAANALNNMGTIYKELQHKSKAANCWNRALQLYQEFPEAERNTANMQKIEQNLRDLNEGF